MKNCIQDISSLNAGGRSYDLIVESINSENSTDGICLQPYREGEDLQVLNITKSIDFQLIRTATGEMVMAICTPANYKNYATFLPDKSFNYFSDYHLLPSWLHIDERLVHPHPH